MAEITDSDRKALLRLARSAIEAKLIPESSVDSPTDPSPVLKENRGCFVTLHKRGQLRGCIGTIEPTTSLAEGVEENAINAAYHDPRFPPLSKEELSEVEIEVSVLTLPKLLPFSDASDLKAQLKPGTHGVILSRGWQRATFLPQVWEQLPKAETFLENLCLKAGMEGTCWRDTDTIVKTYEAEYFSET